MDSQPIPYAVKHKDINVRIESRSGGIFTALSDVILEKTGIVYGCALDNGFKAIHRRAESKAERDAFRGSKYVQSDLGNTFKEVKKDLEQGRYVLFSGTSCQIAGIKKYLELIHIDCSKLLLIDIVCHGVPSPKVWENYLRWFEHKYNGKVTTVDFRNKKDYGWAEHIETISIDGKNHDSKIFTTLFYKHSILRNCCYKCPYKSRYHPGDITIADFWGIEKALPDFSDNKGVSLVLVNNSKGKEYMEKGSFFIDKQLVDINDCLQIPLIKPFEKPKDREKFWADYEKKPFGYIARKYGEISVKAKIRKKISTTVPVGIKKKIKKYCSR